MLKRLGVALAALFAFVGIAQGAGTVPGFSLTPQFDLTGRVMPGCKLFVYQAGTVAAPQTAYQDTGLTNPSPGGSVLTCDASGRLPQWFVADGLIKLRLVTAAGSQVFAQDNLLVVGPSSGGGGGGGTVDPTTIASTGDVKSAYGTSVLSGWVRMNGRTIGSATSGATERANSDVQALFVYLWGAPGTALTVSGGRSASAAADWAANKTIATPDMRGRTFAGLNDMGNSESSVLTTVYAGCLSGGPTTQLGISCGQQSHTLGLTEIPTGITSSVIQDISVGGSLVASHAVSGGSSGGGGFTFNVPVDGTINFTAHALNTIFVTSTNTGGGAHSIVPPMMLVTYYIKL